MKLVKVEEAELLRLRALVREARQIMLCQGTVGLPAEWQARRTRFFQESGAAKLLAGQAGQPGAQPEAQAAPRANEVVQIGADRYEIVYAVGMPGTGKEVLTLQQKGGRRFVCTRQKTERFPEGVYSTPVALPDD